MNKREFIQQRIAECLVYEGFNSLIILAAPRIGKSCSLIKAFKQTPNSKILIIAPYNSILESWEEEIIKWDASHLDITVKNQRSLDKVKLGEYDIICCSEIHTLSEQQIGILAALKTKSKIFGETGSLSEFTKQQLYYRLGLEVKFEYSLEQAIEDKVISDYKIRVIYCELDDTIKNIESGNKFKKFLTTERQAYNYLTQQFDRCKEQELLGDSKAGKTKLFYAGQRARLIYSSQNKLALARKLIANSQRVMCFTSLIKNASKLTKYSYHSKSKGNELEQFINCTINKLTVIQQVSMGITIPSLKYIVAHQLQSNSETALQKLLRCMNFDRGIDAQIDLLVVKDTVDYDWSIKALSEFNPNKITYLNYNEVNWNL